MTKGVTKFVNGYMGADLTKDVTKFINGSWGVDFVKGVIEFIGKFIYNDKGVYKNC